MDSNGYVGVSEVGGGGLMRSGPRPSSSLECLGITVRSDEEASHVHEEKCLALNPHGAITHIQADRCKDWFCPHCAEVQGPKLRKLAISMRSEAG
jgi:hypothetical protein